MIKVGTHGGVWLLEKSVTLAYAASMKQIDSFVFFKITLVFYTTVEFDDLSHFQAGTLLLKHEIILW